MIARRTFVRAAGALALTSCAPALRPPDTSAVWCGSGEARTLPPLGADGWFARHASGGEPLVLRAARIAGSRSLPWRTAFTTTPQGVALRNPTLVFQSGERARIRLENALDAPTIVHWHGVANDTANDGGGLRLAAPGTHYEYDFAVRERSGLYWYHPHPHGASAGQVYEGLFGLLAIEDDDERELRRALDLQWGTTELPLILQDRREVGYAIDALDRHRGMLGHVPTINGCVEPALDVATRRYRLRILNASSARTYLLALRDAAGGTRAFTLLGTDGGLLAAPVRCEACYLSPAERVDMLVDLSDAAIGDAFVLQTRPFDPMHTKPPADARSDAMPQHSMSGATAMQRSPMHDGWPEGGERGLLTMRVRERVQTRGALPVTLSQLRSLDVAGARERPLRLGFNKGRWRINDRTFAMDETPIELARDRTEVWLLRNYHTSMPHAMHLHGTHFQVLERETSPEQLAPLVVDSHGRVASDLGWKDTVLVWPGESVRIALRFELPYAGAQTYMFHCHNLEHEDGGMMLGVRVT